MFLLPFIDVTEESVEAFLDLNALAHETIFTALLDMGVVIEHYPLHTDQPDSGWLDLHYREHQAWANALGLPAPPDLQALDVRSEAARATWMQNHYLHHQVVSQALGL